MAEPASTGALRGDPATAQIRIAAIVGPTGSGKSEIAMRVAERMGAEIVAVDSMTIYRGMDIGTAKPPPADRDRVVHHLIDIADPADPYSVAQFQQVARAAIGRVAMGRRVPLLVGGSGLYFRAVVDDLTFPPTDEAVRSAIAEQDPDALRERLRSLDPVAAASIDPSNLRRVVRALEVTQLTGSPFSAFREAWDRYESPYDLTVAGIALPPEILKTRIARRTGRMFEAGLVDEVRALLDRGLRSALTASRAIAYGEIVAHLDGTISLDEAQAAIESATWRYARRQMTWFRKDPRIRWFDADDPAQIADPVGVWFGGKDSGSPLRPQ
ncbi:MAG TPA: tRNA (adenosine(37)-N6)-dimethylallyltransferase MiaA [Actinomycetota bacterium]